MTAPAVTAPAVTSPAVTFPAVRAEAVVRSRDGRSVLDWDEDGTEPVKAYTADPIRVHTAVTTLEGHGFTVDGVDAVTVRFRGPAEAYSAVFAVVLDGPTDSSSWQVAGASYFDVAASTPLGGVLHRVLLTAPPTPLVQPIGEPAFPAVRPLDLLLGEIGESLGAEVPQRFERGEALPGAAAVLGATRDSLERWASDPLRRALGAHIATVRTDPSRRVTTFIAEPAVDAGIPEAFARLWPNRQERDARRALRFEVDRPVSRFDDDDVFLDQAAWRSGTTDAHVRRAAHTIAMADLVLRKIVPAWRHVRRDLAAVVVARPTYGSWTGLRQELLALMVLAGTLTEGTPEDEDSPITRVTTLVEQLDQDTTVDDARRLWAALARAVGGFASWLGVQHHHFRTAYSRAAARRNRHATMVSYDYLAVTLGALDARLHQDYELFWKGIVRPERWVFSYSAGKRCDVDLADSRWQRRWARAELTVRPSVLHVMAAGNRIPDAGDWPQHSAVFAADLDNALVVGGCEPVGDRWRASDATHGYTVRLPGSLTARQVDLTIPHVCATTRGTYGGSVVFPRTPADPSSTAALEWDAGGGSSQATPIVAAACALVWSAFPQLSPKQVKAAVLAGAADLEGGAFHIPAHGAAGIDPLSNPAARNTGARRVVLRGALVEAARGYAATLGAPLRTLLVEPAGGTP